MLHDILTKALGPLKHVSWGTLYPMIRRLEEDGFIAQKKGDPTEATGRPRKVYALTERGHARFLALMAEPLQSDADTLDTFHVKLTNFGFVSVDLRRKILLQYRDHVEFVYDRLVDSHARVSMEPSMTPEERPWVLRSIEHSRLLTEADLAWIDAQILEVGMNG